MSQLKKLTIKGFKSIRSLENLELRHLNVLIGANGAGKSNFIAFFKLLNELMKSSLQLHVAQRGGPDALLHYGRRTTNQIQAEFFFGDNGYFIDLVPTMDNRLVFAREVLRYHLDGVVQSQESRGSGQAETLIYKLDEIPPSVEAELILSILSWKVYHFHDTSDVAKVKQLGAINDLPGLRPDASNLAALLYQLQRTHPKAYEQIRDVIRLVMPSFDDFILRPWPHDPNKMALEWKEQGSDEPFLAHQLSDGTLRFICLATLLLQPTLPATILIDEPELGLHPYAINVLASLFRSTSTRAQLVVATQSVPLIDALELEDLIVVEKSEGQSVFRRLPPQEFAHWLEDYSLGELWMKNVLGGRPSR